MWKGAEEKVFKLDYIFDATTNQEDVFKFVEPLLKSALDGYSVCVLAYGQTGKRRTYNL